MAEEVRPPKSALQRPKKKPAFMISGPAKRGAKGDFRSANAEGTEDRVHLRGGL